MRPPMLVMAVATCLLALILRPDGAEARLSVDDPHNRELHGKLDSELRM